ncbi:unnamed protein product [Cuscuta europaea]|uniref:Uncharacterized protein n=1 Tax=Cuscuta europaea TaxID=41803 RepID=A0A9P0ZIU5_CUSEU|nr:unnamed protein product [Cuscuta europaea]
MFLAHSTNLISRPSSPAKGKFGRIPVTISNINTPKLYTSPIVVALAAPWMYSGGMYPIVPATCVETSMWDPSVCLANPKSAIWDSKFSSKSTLLAFISL